jgi:hypothetical protein
LAEKFGGYIYATPLKEEIKANVKRLRNSSGLDIEKITEIPLCNTVKGLKFYQGRISITLNGIFLNAVFWASTECMNLLKQSDHLFVDATFRIVPQHYKQLLIFMGHHTTTDVYFPAMYVLMDSKKECAYEYVLRVVFSWVGNSQLPKRVTTDFEQGLINVLCQVLPNDTDYIGCYFHFKHAIRRKLIELGFGNNAEYLTNLSGVLTLINLCEIELCLEYIEEKALAIAPNMEEKIKKFHDYFIEYWKPKFNFWNISRFATVYSKLKRTNNCVERYNRRLNEMFLVSHPNIAQLANVLKGEECYYTEYIKSIMEGIQTHERGPELEFPSCKDFRQWYPLRKTLVIRKIMKEMFWRYWETLVLRT